MPKAPDAFRTISEAAEELGLPQHVLRHWEETFGAIRPMRRAGGRRYYRLQDLELLKGVQALLHSERYTTKGVQKIFKDQGAGFIAEIGKKVLAGASPEYALASQANGQDQDSVSLSKETITGLMARLQSLKSDIAAVKKELQTPPRGSAS